MKHAKFEIRNETLRRYGLLVVSLFVLALGSAVTIRANLGSSPVSILPYTWFMADGKELIIFGIHAKIPPFSMGAYTILLNTLLIISQMIILKKIHQTIYVTQFIAGLVFGLFMDAAMAITAFLQSGGPDANMLLRFVQMLAGGTIIGLGIVCEVKSNTTMLPAEGFSIAITKATGKDFGKCKIIADTSLVGLGVLCCLLFFGGWRWDISGIGTLVSMIYVGVVVRYLSPRMGWFEKIVTGNPCHEIRQEHTKENLSQSPRVVTIAREEIIEEERKTA